MAMRNVKQCSAFYPWVWIYKSLPSYIWWCGRKKNDLPWNVHFLIPKIYECITLWFKLNFTGIFTVKNIEMSKLHGLSRLARSNHMHPQEWRRLGREVGHRHAVWRGSSLYCWLEDERKESQNKEWWPLATGITLSLPPERKQGPQIYKHKELNPTNNHRKWILFY